MITSLSQLDLSKTYTYADYLTWQLDEFVELIKGKIVTMSPAPGTYHQNISGNLYGELYQYLKKKKCKVFSAPFDVRLIRNNNDHEIKTVVQPDICIVCDPSILDDKGCNGAPDMIIEILSPNTRKKDVNEKFELYEESGVREYWIVGPLDQVVDVFLLENGKYRLLKKYSREESVKVNVLEDLVIDLKEIFE